MRERQDSGSFHHWGDGFLPFPLSGGRTSRVRRIGGYERHAVQGLRGRSGTFCSDAGGTDASLKGYAARGGTALPITIKRAQAYRQRAQELRAKAASMIGEAAKSAALETAREYDALASVLERRSKRKKET